MTDAARRWEIARRTLLVAAGVVGGGLLVGAGAVMARLYSIEQYKLPAGEGEISFGAWLKLARDGKISVTVPHQEMGQGIYSLAVLLTAEVLRLPPDAVRAEPAPVHARFANPIMLLDGLPFNEHAEGVLEEATVWTFEKILRAVGISATGGSTSTRHLVEPIRNCATTMLDMLKRLRPRSSALRSRRYAELATEAAKLSPKSVALPPLAHGTYIGKGIPRADVPPKVRGVAQYGIDVREQGQLYAAIRHSPRIGGVLRQASLPNGLPGVRGLVLGRDYVAVAASNYFQAATALDKSAINWDDSKALSISTVDVLAAYRAALDQGAGYRPRWVLDSQGEPGAATGRKVAATYDAPFLAHATMEPINATALVTTRGVKVWAGHQSGFLAQWQAAGAAGVSRDSVEVATPYLGGGFGRRAYLEYIVKAVAIASKFKGTPVQTIWSRAEDIRDDVYRPAAMADISATLAASGLPSSLVYRIAVPSVTEQFGYVRRCYVRRSECIRSRKGC
jgi:isoquinoline 1-oxidoreductase subunit beta